MGSQINLTISLVMLALFTTAIISFAIGFAEDNNAEVDISKDPAISNLNIASNLDTFKDDSEDTYSSISDSTIEPGSDVIKSTGSFTITWKNVFGVTKNIVDVGYKKIFGSGGGFGVFFTTLIGMIIFIYALYLIKTWKGNP